MINREKQMITSPYGPRTMDGKEKMHRGVDLRCVDFKTWKDQEVIAPEACEVLRIGKDFLVVEPIDSYSRGYRELKFIHIKDDIIKDFDIGCILEKGDLIGNCVDYPKGKHLHMEVWREYTKKVIIPINPVEYFIEMGIEFEYKEGVK